MKWLPAILLLTLIFPTHESFALHQKKDEKAKSTDKAKEKEKPKFQFMRLRKDGRKIMAMETNVIRYTDSIKHPGTTVDLIGAIHLGDPAYYDKLNKLFEQYDVLLYEAVKDENVNIARGAPRAGGMAKKGEMSTDTMVGLSVVGTLQTGMTDVLGLEHQMAGVDYSKKNFVHADMTTKEFNKTLADRGESFAGMMAREMGKALQKGQAGNPLAQNIDMALSMMLGDRQIRLRRIMATQLTDAGADDAFADENGESTIITERNKKAFQVLDRELEKGHKKIGVFYGAAHLPDMHKRLKEEFYYTKGDVKWLEAWKLRRDKSKKKPEADAKTPEKK